MLLLSPGCVQVAEMAPPFLVVSGNCKLRVDFPDSERSWAELHSSRRLGAASLSQVVEVLSAHFDVLDPEAVTVLPGILDLVVAQPGLAVEGALLVLLVQGRDVLPAGVEARCSLDALVREVVEISRVDCLHQVALDVQHIAIE